MTETMKAGQKCPAFSIVDHVCPPRLCGQGLRKACPRECGVRYGRGRTERQKVA